MRNAWGDKIKKTDNPKVAGSVAISPLGVTQIGLPDLRFDGTDKIARTAAEGNNTCGSPLSGTRLPLASGGFYGLSQTAFLSGNPPLCISLLSKSQNRLHSLRSMAKQGFQV